MTPFNRRPETEWHDVPLNRRVHCAVNTCNKFARRLRISRPIVPGQTMQHGPFFYYFCHEHRWGVQNVKIAHLLDRGFQPGWEVKIAIAAERKLA